METENVFTAIQNAIKTIDNFKVTNELTEQELRVWGHARSKLLEACGFMVAVEVIMGEHDA